MLKALSKTFFTGLVTILPVVLTLYLLYWLVISTEALLGSLIRLVLPDEYYWPGMGVIVAIAVILGIGLLMHAYLVQRIFSMSEALLYRVPLIKSVYRSIHDFLEYFSPETRKEFEQVVAVKIADTQMEVIGFVTRAQPEQLPEGFGTEDSVLVYLPLSYMIGGYTVLMPRSAVRPLPMKMEEAMRFALTAGVGSTFTPVAVKKTDSERDSQ